MPDKINKLPLITPIFSNKNVGINIDGNLQLSKEVSFRDVVEYFENEYNTFLQNNPELQFDQIPGGYLEGYYLFELYDSGDDLIARKFEKLLNEKSESKVYIFFIENGLYDATNVKNEVNLEEFYHIKFV